MMVAAESAGKEVSESEVSILSLWSAHTLLYVTLILTLHQSKPYSLHFTILNPGTPKTNFKIYGVQHFAISIWLLELHNVYDTYILLSLACTLIKTTVLFTAQLMLVNTR